MDLRRVAGELYNRRNMIYHPHCSLPLRPIAGRINGYIGNLISTRRVEIDRAVNAYGNISIYLVIRTCARVLINRALLVRNGFVSNHGNRGGGCHPRQGL